MKVVALVIFIICIPFVIFPLFVVSLQMITSATFWIIVGICVALFVVYMIAEKKQKGFLKEVSGFIFADGVNSSERSILRLYPDKITVNDIQTIPIDRVKQATFDTHTSVVRGYGGFAKRRTYILTVSFTNKDGKNSFITCKSKINESFADIDYIRMEQKINKLVGYEPPKPNYPDKPYEL